MGRGGGGRGEGVVKGEGMWVDGKLVYLTMGEGVVGGGSKLK